MAGRRGGGDDEPPRRRKRNMLRLFYGADTASQPQATGDPMDIDCSAFDADMYLKQMYSKMALPQLVAKERSLSQQVKTLDSDMQTLVYENYNKFISATDTIRQMKSKVDDMEEEMGKLSEHMQEIGALSDGITSTLSVKRTRIKKLTESHMLLKKLQFLFELPSRLKKCLERKAYSEAVRYYDRAVVVLEQYKELDSFKGIYDECQTIMAEVVASINALIDEEGASMDQVMENLELLVVLKHDASELCNRAFAFIRSNFERDCAAQQKAFKAASASYDPEAIALEEEEKAKAAAEAAAAAAAAAKAKAEAEAEAKRNAVGADEDDEGHEDDVERAAKEDVDRRALFGDEDDGPSPQGGSSGGDGGGGGGARGTADSADRGGNGGTVDEDADPYPAVVAKHPLVVMARYGCSRCLPQLQEWIYCYIEVFVNPGRQLSLGGQGSETPVTPRALHNKEVADAAEAALTAFVDELVGVGYVGECTKTFFDEIARGVDTEVVVAAISTLSQGVLMIHDTVPQGGLLAKDEELAVMVVRKLCRQRGEVLQGDLARKMKESTAALSTIAADQYPATLASLCRWMYSRCCEALRTLEPLVAEDFACRSRFFERELQERSIRKGIVQGYIGAILAHCRQTVEVAPEVGADAADLPRVALFLSGLCVRLEDGLIEKLVLFSIKLFPTATTNGQSGRNSSGDRGRGGKSGPALDDASEMQVAQRVHEARTTALALLDRYVREAGAAIAESLRTQLALTQWAGDVPEPTVVSPHVQEVGKAITAVRAAVNEMFAADGDGESVDRPGGSRSYAEYKRQRTSVDANIHNLFQDRIVVFGVSDFVPREIVFGVIKVVLKATAEIIRMLTFSRHGMQQVEVDVHSLGTLLWPLVGAESNEQTAATLLSQLVDSATTRCIDPSPLSDAIIAMICGEASESLA